MSKYIRSSFPGTVFLFIWLFTSFTFSMGSECLCCTQDETHGKHHGKTHSARCCSPLDDFSHKCSCECVSCSKAGDNETVSEKKFITSFEKHDETTRSQFPSQTIGSVNQQYETQYQQITFPLKFLPLYLIKESLLL